MRNSLIGNVPSSRRECRRSGVTRHAEEARAELSRGSQKKEEMRGERRGKGRRLTQHSLNCFASMGDVKFKPQVSLVIGSFQYTKHSDAWPMRVPKSNNTEIFHSRRWLMMPVCHCATYPAARAARRESYPPGCCKRWCERRTRASPGCKWCWRARDLRRLVAISPVRRRSQPHGTLPPTT